MDEAVEPTILDQVKKAVTELKNNKAAGKDEILVELLKHGSEQLHQSIPKIMVKIWEDEELPTS